MSVQYLVSYLLFYDFCHLYLKLFIAAIIEYNIFEGLTYYLDFYFIIIQIYNRLEKL